MSQYELNFFFQLLAQIKVLVYLVALLEHYIWFACASLHFILKSGLLMSCYYLMKTEILKINGVWFRKLFLKTL